MPETRTRRQSVVRAVKVVLVVVAVVLAFRAVSGQASRVRDNLGSLTVGWTLVALVTSLVGQAVIAMIWRSVLADLGNPLPPLTASRIFLVAQLGKYIPGSVFAVAGQMELATRYDVPRQRSGAASLVTLVLNTAVGGLVALCALPLLPDRLAHRFLPALALLPLVVVLHPRVFTALMQRGLRLLRRPPLDHPLSWGGVLRAAAWGAASWLLLGLHVWALCRDVGAVEPVLALGITGFAAAWLVGFVVVIAPAGFGPREGVLVAVLGGSLAGGTGAALVVAGLSRLLLVLGDLVLAGLALLVGRSPERHREQALSGS